MTGVERAARPEPRNHLRMREVFTWLTDRPPLPGRTLRHARDAEPHLVVQFGLAERRPRLARQPRRVVRLVHLRVVRDLLRRRLLPGARRDRAAAVDRRGLRDRVPDAAPGRLGAGAVRRPPRAPRRAHALRLLDVRGLAGDRLQPRLRVHRHRRTRPAGGGPHHPGALARGRVRHQRVVPHRGRRPSPPQLLRQLPVRLDRARPAARPGDDDRPAAPPLRVGDERVGMAGALRPRRRSSA